MEWVETTGRSIDEAKERALDQLGVHEEDADFDVLEEPRPGLFGRIRGEARVRARVRPTQPRAKTERRERKRKPSPADTEATGDAGDASSADVAATEAALASEAAATTAAGAAATTAAKPRSRSKPRAAVEASTDRSKASTTRVTEPGIGELDEVDDGPTDRTDGADEGDTEARTAERTAAVAFLQGLADALGEPDAVATVTVLGDDEAEVRLDGGDLGLLIGPRGQTLIAVQDLMRLAAQKRGTDRRGKLRIDIAGYRERRREALARFTEQVADEVRSTGTARALEPMSSMDRKIVHDAANELDGVETISEGEDPFRRVVIRPTLSV